MFLAKKSKNKIALILSIQSSIVRSSLVLSETGRPPIILFNHNHIIKFREKLDESFLINSTDKAVKEALNNALSALYGMSRADSRVPRHIEDIHFVLSSPWIASYARSLHQSFGRNLVVTRKGIFNLINKERAKVDVMKDNYEIVEEKVFDVKLNGYSVPEWEGKAANELDVAFASSVADRNIIRQFKSLCDGNAYRNSVNFHSSLLLYYIAIKSVFPEKANYALIHIHGELTDILIIRNHLCVYFGSFAWGINTVIRTIGKYLEVSEAMADSYLSLFVGKKMETEEHKNAEEVLAKISDEWIKGLLDSVEKHSYEGKIPEEVYVISRIHEDFFVKSYKSRFDNASVAPMDREILSKSVAFAPKVENLRVIALYAIALNILE